MSAVAERLSGVKADIARAAEASGRDAGDVTLVAVSKTHPPELIREAYAAGQRAFGESYAQELAGKAAALADLTDLEWHFIGHLQSNKARVIVQHARVVHTVDTTGLARELGKRVPAGATPLTVLLEVNIGGQTQKFGVSPGELSALIDAVSREPGLRLAGLMTMPPAGDAAVARRVFETLATLRAVHGGAAVLPQLSMGMSSDLDVAIACGATMVRVGTAIFGAR